MSEEQVIRHIIQKEKQPEKPKEKPINNDKLQSKLDERESQMVALISHNLELQKEFAVDRYPQHKSEINDAENESVLDDLIAKFEDSEIPRKAPSGKARLIEQPDYNSSLSQAEDETQLINRLYEKARYKGRDAEQQKQRLEAKERIDKLYKAMVENPKLGRKVKELPETVRDYQICPVCNSVVEVDFNRKGGTCPVCGFVAGEGTYVRRM